MANFCERCKHAMSAHDNHASCPICRVAAGDCSVDPKNPCTTCEGWTRKQWARTLSPAQQGRAEVTVHSSGRGDSRSPLPWWPSQPWFPHLLRLCVEHPLSLPYRQDLLSQQDQKYISDGKSFHLHAWRLSCDITKQQAFQTRSLGSQQLLGDPRPIACTTTDGVVLHDGLRDKVLTHLTPQPLR